MYILDIVDGQSYVASQFFVLIGCNGELVTSVTRASSESRPVIDAIWD